MKPLVVKLKNFGPFLNETIDFRQLQENHLFLISGKTGSGKTMIFDAIVFALFGEASTKDRKEGELRSHFADGKSPMIVEFEFKIRNQQFKIFRQGAFHKEGNKSPTLGQLSIYELVDNQYKLIESKISSGKRYLIDLLGVNVEQFRQLFILPQGEFKRFLLSKSSEKQEILRTLFNSQRFVDIQNKLSEDINEVKSHIEQQYQLLESNWQEINTFDNEILNAHKQITARQTQKILELLPEYTEIGHSIKNELKQQKDFQSKMLKDAEIKLEKNLKLEEAFKNLKTKNEEYEKLITEESEIKTKEKLVKELNEVRPIATLVDTQQKLLDKTAKTTTELEEKQNIVIDISKQLETHSIELNQYKTNNEEIEKKREFLNQCKLFYENAQKYQTSYHSLKQLTETYDEMANKYQQQQNKLNEQKNKLNNRKADYSKIESLNEEIYKLTSHINELKQIDKRKEEHQQLAEETIQIEEKLEQSLNEIQLLKDKYASIDKSNIDLNNKQEIIANIQSAIEVGEQCPICGHEVTEVEQHVDFEDISKRHQEIAELENLLNQQQNKKIQYESELRIKREQLSKFETDIKTDTKTDDLENQLQNKENEKRQLNEENKQVEQLKEHLQQLNQAEHDSQLKLKNIDHEIKQNEITIQDFEKTTQYQDVTLFVQNYKHELKTVQDYDTSLSELERTVQNLTNKLSIEQNNVHFLSQNVSETKAELKQMDNQINSEMKKIGFDSIDQIKIVMERLPEKDKLERTIEQYKKNRQTLEIEIEQLKKQTENEQLEDITQLKSQLQEQQQSYEQIASQLSQHEYKVEFNETKIKIIKQMVEKLEEDLKEQQEIFQLSEVLSGKNPQKLTLENYVLIHYLQRILIQANKRLAIMSGQRYQLVRRQQVSQGYSGLEIDVFDNHSNRSRHITSLSGGETFQASLALALGLSEVVQEESGGISLDSMFVDEGFGTLDQETLETALDTLVGLKSTGRMVGIISHVSELKQRIPLILEVETKQYHSTTRFKMQ